MCGFHRKKRRLYNIYMELYPGFVQFFRQNGNISGNFYK